jgi:uncharacterized protein (DUF58 family)
MNLNHHLATFAQFKNLEILANQIVEGYISGKHKSPFHGFSAEFAEHKIYNAGESTKSIDWKLFAKTDRFYTKKYEEETNLRCHIIIDNSSSMHFPKLEANEGFEKTKIGFSVLATAVLMNLLKKQRDAVGLSLFSEGLDFYAPEKGSDRHHANLLKQLETLVQKPPIEKKTATVPFLHLIAEKIHRRSMIVLFTDMFQNEDLEDLFDALTHLKHQKNKVVIFHVHDKASEIDFEFPNEPRKFIDLESGEHVTLFADQIQKEYQTQIEAFFKKIKWACLQHRITYVPVNVSSNFDEIMTTYLVEKQRFS